MILIYDTHQMILRAHCERGSESYECSRDDSHSVHCERCSESYECCSGRGMIHTQCTGREVVSHTSVAEIQNASQSALRDG